MNFLSLFVMVAATALSGIGGALWFEQRYGIQTRAKKLQAMGFGYLVALIMMFGQFYLAFHGVLK